MMTGRTPMDCTSSTFGAVFDGLPSDAVKTMEALELSQALQRVRSSRRRRKEEGGGGGGGGRREGRKPRNQNDTAERPSGSSSKEGEAVRGKAGLGGEGSEEDGSGLLGRGSDGKFEVPLAVAKPAEV
ncbi:unnamed protein product [Ectocarpus fasciculatus]